MSKPAVLVQEEEDIWGYNLNEKQKATKTRCPPVSEKSECLDHTDPCMGDTLEEAFERSTRAMLAT